MKRKVIPAMKYIDSSEEIELPNNPSSELRKKLIKGLLNEAATRLRLAYPDNEPKLHELHIADVTLKGMDEYEEFMATEISALLQEQIDSVLDRVEGMIGEELSGFVKGSSNEAVINTVKHRMRGQIANLRTELGEGK